MKSCPETKERVMEKLWSSGREQRARIAVAVRVKGGGDWRDSY